jgi:integrase
MATTTNGHRDRFLQRRGERWHYVRRIPARVADADPRGPRIRVALQTDDLAVARAMRDALEKADHDLWAALLAGDGTDAAVKRYAAASRRAAALGFGYRPAAELAAKASWQELAERMETISDIRTPHAAEKAVLGGEPEPSVPLSRALKVYFNDIAASRLMTKSLNQRRKWKIVPERAVRTFSEVVSDKPIGEITREDAHKFYRWWRDRIAPQEKGATATHTPSSGNREIGSLRALYREYFEFMGEPDRDNPFAGLNFEERTKTKRTRPPFPTAWLKDKILKAPALKGLNEQARAILMVTIETGARPSEICNLKGEHIFVDAEVPYISITERDDPDSPRELKTGASIREIPLVGAALVAFEKFPKGFPRYFEKEESACAAINKYLRENKLVPSPRHTLYSIRHSFEDRMKEAGIDEEMREIFFGHRRSRQEYGSGGALAWRRSLLERLVLPFDGNLL